MWVRHACAHLHIPGRQLPIECARARCIWTGSCRDCIRRGCRIPLERFSEGSGALSLSAGTQYASRVCRPVVGGRTIYVHRRVALPRLSKAAAWQRPVKRQSTEVISHVFFFFLFSTFEKFHLLKISSLEKFPLKYFLKMLIFFVNQNYYSLRCKIVTAVAVILLLWKISVRRYDKYVVTTNIWKIRSKAGMIDFSHARRHDILPACIATASVLQNDGSWYAIKCNPSEPVLAMHQDERVRRKRIFIVFQKKRKVFVID